MMEEKQTVNPYRQNLIYEAIYGDGENEGLNIPAILEYCKLTNWEMYDSKSNSLKLVDKQMLIDNATDLINEALDKLGIIYNKYLNREVTKDNLQFSVHTGLFKVCAFIEDNYDNENGLSEYINVDIEFIGDASYSSGKINDLIG